MGRWERWACCREPDRCRVVQTVWRFLDDENTSIALAVCDYDAVPELPVVLLAPEPGVGGGGGGGGGGRGCFVCAES